MADQRTEHTERTTSTLDPEEDRVETERTMKEKSSSQGSAQGSTQQPNQGIRQDSERSEK